MGHYTMIEVLGTNAVMEVDDGEGVRLQLLGMGEKWPKFEDAVDAMKRGGEYLLGQVKSLAPSEMELSCGFKVGAEGGNTFWGFAKTSGEAIFSVKLKWAIEKKK